MTDNNRYNTKWRKACKNCGGIFYGTNAHKFCSDDCRYYFKNEPKIIKVVCLNCRQPFKRQTKKTAMPGLLSGGKYVALKSVQ